MTDYATPHRTEHRPCARGCTVARKHLAACENQDECRGCRPRTADYGDLCYGCYKRLINLLEVAAGQVTLLDVMAGLKGEVEMTAMTVAKIRTSWRTDSDQDFRTLYAKGVVAAHSASEPIRLACIDAQRQIEDRLNLWVLNLVNDYRMSDPEGGPVAMADFLIRHIERLIWRPGIGDELEEFASIMAQAHTLAPWREVAARLRGIPCPECHTTTLVMFGGDSDVTCLRCKATMSHQRYGVWTRILADEHKTAGA